MITIAKFSKEESMYNFNTMKRDGIIINIIVILYKIGETVIIYIQKNLLLLLVLYNWRAMEEF